MRITALLENTTTRADMAVEHGLSLWIEAAGKTILFDMGQSDLFAKNAERLGCDLRTVDFAILSHGHYDHGGGLPTFLAINDRAPIYLSRYAFGEQYNASGKYIGLDPLLEQNPRLRFTDGVTSVAPGFTLLDCNDRTRRGTLGTFGLTRREGDLLMPDDFRHEQYLLIEAEGKRVLLSGCSHKGIDDIAAWFCPDVLVGGFHVSKLADPAALSALAQSLNAHPTAYYTCHCTGLRQYDHLKEKLGELKSYTPPHGSHLLHSGLWFSYL